MSDTYYCALDGTPFEADWSVRCECTRCMPLDRPDPPDPGEQLASAFRAYQAALNNDAYWKSPEEREQNKQQVGEAFDQLVQLSNQILGDIT